MWGPLIPKVEDRLGLPNGLLDYKDIGTLWQMCQQESSLFSEESHSCSIFDDEDVELMEYVEDTLAFARKGHLCPEAYLMAKDLLRDISSSLSKAASGSSVRARFHFAHAETMGPLAAALGLFGASKTLDNKACIVNLDSALPKEPSKRQWWASTVMPFGANAAFLLHSKGPEDPFLIRFFWNEQIVPNSACDGALDCPLDLVLEYLRSRLDIVDMELDSLQVAR